MPEQSKATRRQVLQVTAGALTAGALSGRGAAQASGPTVYVGSEDNKLYAVDAATGEQEWAFDTGDWVNSSPTVADGIVYVGAGKYDMNDGRLYAVDAATGSQQWAFYTGNRVYSSPTAVHGTVYAGSGTFEGGTLHAVDAATGEQEWAFDTGDWVNSSPTVADGTVYVGADGKLYAVDAATGSQHWAFEIYSLDDVESSPTVVDGTVYIGSYDWNLYAVDASTGEQEWAFDTGSSVWSSPTVVDGTVYVGSRDGKLYAVDAGTGEQEWAFDTGNYVDSSPTVVDGTVYVGSDSLYAVDAETGEQEWAFDTGLSVESSPTVVDDTVYVGSDDEKLYAVDAATGEQEWAFETGLNVKSSPTVVDDPENGDSIDSRVMMGTLGHHGNWRYAGQNVFADFNVSVTGTNATVAGESLSVPVEVTANNGGQTTQPISLSVPNLGRDLEQVTLSGGDTTTVTLSVPTSSGEAREYTATVESENDTASTSVTVREPASFSVNIDGTTTPAEGGTLDVTVAVENTGGSSDTRNMSLSVPGLGSDSSTVSLDSGQSTTQRLSVPTSEGDAGEYIATVQGGENTASTDVTVLEPASFNINITETNEPVSEEDITVTAEVTNQGDVQAERSVELDAGALGTDSTTVSLNGGEAITETFSVSTNEGDAGEYTATVQGGENTASTDVTVLEPASFDVTITETNEPVAGEDITVTAEVTNQGDVQAERSVELDAGAPGTDSTTVSLNGGEAITETFSVSTSEGNASEYTISVVSPDSDATATVTVDAQPTGSGTTSGGSDGGSSIDGSNGGDGGGVGTPEVVAVGVGGLALLGAYKVMRSDDNSSGPRRSDNTVKTRQRPSAGQRDNTGKSNTDASSDDARDTSDTGVHEPVAASRDNETEASVDEDVEESVEAEDGSGLTDLGGVDSEVAEALREAGYETTEHVAAASQEQLQAVDGVSTALSARMKTETDDIEASDEVASAVADLGTVETEETATVTEADDDEQEEITELTDISRVGEGKAEALREAGYGTVDYVRGASQEELSDVDGIGMALAARIKADVGDTTPDETAEALGDVRSEIKTESDIQKTLDNAEETLDKAAAALDSGNQDDALSKLEDVSTTLETVSEVVGIFSEFNPRRLKLENRREQLHDQAQTQKEAVDSIDRTEQKLEDAESALDSDLPQEAKQTSSEKQSRVDYLRAKAEQEYEQETKQASSEFTNLIESVTDSFSQAEAHLKEGSFEQAYEELKEAEETINEASSLNERQSLKREDDIETKRERIQTAMELVDQAQTQQQSIQRALQSSSYDSAESELSKLQDTLEQIAAHDGIDVSSDDLQQSVNQFEDRIATGRADRRLTGLFGAIGSSRSSAEDCFEEGSYDRARRRLDSAFESVEKATSLNERHDLGKDEKISEKRDQIEELRSEFEQKSREEHSKHITKAEEAISRGIEQREADNPAGAVDAFTEAQEHYDKALKLAEAYELPGLWETEQRHSMLTEYLEVAREELEERRHATRNELEQALEAAESSVSRAEQYDEVNDHVSARESLSGAIDHLDEATQLLNVEGVTDQQQSRYDDLVDRAETVQKNLPDEEDSGRYRNQDLVESLQRLATKLGESPRPEFVNEYGEYPADAYLDAFGSWPEALAAANLDSIDESARDRRSYSRVDILDELVRLSDELGHPPSRTEINRKGNISSTTVENRFQDWDTAIELANISQKGGLSDEVAKTSGTNSDSETPVETVSNQSTPEDDSGSDNKDQSIESSDVTTDVDISSETFAELSAFRRDCLVVINGMDTAKGLEIKDELEQYYDETVNHGRLYPNLDTLEEKGMIEKLKLDERSNGYLLTEFGREHLKQRRQWEAEVRDEFARPNSEPVDVDSNSTAVSDAKHDSSSVVWTELKDDTSSDNSFATIENITEDGRLSQAIVVNVCEISDPSGDREQSSLLVRDTNGDRCRLNIWQTHDVDVAWEVGHWYVLKHVRGKTGTNERGETEQHLSSTGDLSIEHVGPNLPDEIESSTHETEGSTHPKSTDETRTKSETASNKSSEETEPAGILDEVVDEFEGLSDSEGS